MRNPIRSALFGAIGIAAPLLAGCSGNADVRDMMPPQAVASHRTGQPVQAAVINGTARHGVLPNIESEDFREALERSLVRSGKFSEVAGGGFRVEAFITSVHPARVGDKLRVTLEVRYALRRRTLVVWRKSIRSSYEVPIYEVHSDQVRVRDATKGAARENIAMLVRLMDKQRF
jgi:hypothetical protein